MNLFQNKILKKYIVPEIDKIKAAYKIYSEYFHNPEIQENIRNSKEEQFQEGFLRELFVKVLGYTLNPVPNYNLITEQKNETNSKKADGAILVDGEVIGIIELKDSKTTDLKTVEPQAFGYKNYNRKASYVVISNFEKFRFYIDNAIDNIEFNLFTLTLDEFSVLWICLAYENISKNLPKQIKEESVSKEDQITKELYKDYSRFKRELFADLTEQNPQYDKLLLFKKSQKLLDKLLFIFFAEDRNLLPPNSMAEIINQWEKLKELDEYRPLYDRFKKYFGYMNTGHTGKKHDIFAYNGGLFKPDEVLDNVVISDSVLRDNSLRLSHYDFESEVDVNILGHIFENSLTEIEEVIQSVSKGEAVDAAHQTNIRKKDGVFYTPRYITTYIVENTLGKLCSEKKVELELDESEYTAEKRRQKATKQKLADKLKAYREWLLLLTICDPACGSGAFLNAALDYLIREHQLLDELTAKLYGDALVFPDIENAILENNLYGVDISEESVEIAKLSLWLRTAKPHRKLNVLSNNIKCGNSLISDPEVAGDKAFDWHKEFPHVFEKGGFDIVIGNPPYVRQELISDYSSCLAEFYESYAGKADLYIFFYEKAYCIANEGGLISFISSGKFLEANYGKPLLKFISDRTRIIEIIDFKDLNIFDGISAYPLIFTFRKYKPEKDYTFEYQDATKITVNNLSEITQNLSFTRISFNDFIKNDYKLIDNSVSSLIEKIEMGSVRLSDMGLSPLVGVKTGYNDGFFVEQSKYSRSYVFGRSIKKYAPILDEGKIFFPYSFENGAYQLIDDNDDELTYISSRKDKLEGRAIIKDGIVDGKKKWYEYQQINKSLNFEDEYIIYPNVSLGTNFTLSKGKIIDMTGFIIPSNSKYLLAILNSQVTNFLMNIYAISRRGGYLEYKTQYLIKIPIKQIPLSNQQPFIEKVDHIISLNVEFQIKRHHFVDRLKGNFDGIKITGALGNFDELDFKEFGAELKKQKITLSLKQQDDEWEEYFNEYKSECNQLSAQIAATDKAIDKMVYELYGLTKNEIEIIEKVL